MLETMVLICAGSVIMSSAGTSSHDFANMYRTRHTITLSTEDLTSSNKNLINEINDYNDTIEWRSWHVYEPLMTVGLFFLGAGFYFMGIKKLYKGH